MHLYAFNIIKNPSKYALYAFIRSLMITLVLLTYKIK